MTPGPLLIAFLLISVLVPGTARAQASDVPLSQVLFDLLLDSVIMRSTTATVAGNPHEAHYIPGLTQSDVPFELNKALVSQLSTFPIGSSSGGFAYNVDPATGAITPASSSFGPSFAERPLSIGRGRYNFGFNYQHARYKSFEGVDLKDGSLSFLLRHNNCCPPTNNRPKEVTDLTPFFEGDLVRTALSLTLKSDTATVSGNYGVTDSMDVGVVIPIVRVDLRASTRSTIIRLSTGVPGPSDPDPSNLHSWDGLGATVRDLPQRGGSASGLGDVLFRAKYVFMKRPTAGAAVGADVRLPTGDQENLLGSGATQARFLFIGAGSAGNLSPHVNFGYTFSSGELASSLTDFRVPAVQGSDVLAGLTPAGTSLTVPDEVNYTFGFDYAATPKVTAAFDLIGRTLRGIHRFEVSNSSFNYVRVNETQVRTTSLPEVNLADAGRLNLLLGAAGVKVNVSGTMLFTASLLFPITSNGLRPQVTPVIGFDYGF